jgi:hypothetical protein
VSVAWPGLPDVFCAAYNAWVGREEGVA